MPRREIPPDTRSYIKSIAYADGASLALLSWQMHWSGSDMLRITENNENGKTVRLRLDGTVNSTSYGELEAVCLRHQETAGKIILVDMAGVVFMNNEVASKLAMLRSEQLIIINCSPFIETLLNTVEPSDLNNRRPR